MPVIKVSEVFKEYHIGAIIVKALNGVSLNIEIGEFSAIVGPSGSGKSTLLHLLGCLDTQTKGDIYIDDAIISGLNKIELAEIRRRKIGFIFQAYNLIPVLTVFENVSFPLTLLKTKKAAIKEITMAMIEAVGLKGYENRKPMELSGGQQQRVAIARALVKKPKLILADEPTANLDSKTGTEILDLMVKLNMEEKATFVFSTHDKMVMEYARRLIILKDGEIIEDRMKA